MSFRHATPTADEMVLAPSTPADPDENVTLATITAKYPGWPHFEEWKCNEGVYYDW
jgi:hypothetical protein